MSATASIAFLEQPNPPPPLTEPGATMAGLTYMPLQDLRMRRSKAWLRAKRKPELGFYLLNLLTAAFRNVPAGGLEYDDDVLADAAMCDPLRWPEVKAELLSPDEWVRCSDGLIYSRFASEMVNETWAKRKVYSERAASGGNAKEARRQERLRAEREEAERRDAERRAWEEEQAAEARRRAAPANDPAPCPVTQAPAPAIGAAAPQTPASSTPVAAPKQAQACLSVLKEGEGEGERKGVPPSGGLSRTTAGTTRKRAVKPQPGDPPGFLDFWEAFPLKVDRPEAVRAWPGAVRKLDGDWSVIVNAARAYAAEVERNGTPRNFIKHPPGWLNNERWALPAVEPQVDRVRAAVGLATSRAPEPPPRPAAASGPVIEGDCTEEPGGVAGRTLQELLAAQGGIL